MKLAACRRAQKSGTYDEIALVLGRVRHADGGSHASPVNGADRESSWDVWTDYSCRKATIGSTREARLAGTLAGDQSNGDQHRGGDAEGARIKSLNAKEEARHRMRGNPANN